MPEMFGLNAPKAARIMVNIIVTFQLNAASFLISSNHTNLKPLKKLGRKHHAGSDRGRKRTLPKVGPMEDYGHPGSSVGGAVASGSILPVRASSSRAGN